MIVTAAMTIVRKAENSRKTMSEHPERSLLDCYLELNSRKSCKKQEIRWMKSIIQLLDSIQDRAENKAVIEQLEFLENSDLICTCHSQNDGKH